MPLARRDLLLTSAAFLLMGAATQAQPVSAADAAQSLAPGGRLRVAINLGNTVLAQRDAKGELTGISVILARLLAERLKLPLDLIPFPAAGAVFDVMDKGAWDLAFLAIEPERATKIDFTPAYVSIDGTYLVRSVSAFRTPADLDKPGLRIAVGRGAAYDLYLSRVLTQAQLVRAPTSPAAVDLFLSDELDAAAGVRQYLADRAKENPALRVMEDRFSSIDQAIGVPKGRQAGFIYAKAFLEEMKASGQVRKALDATGQTSAAVAPPA